MTTGTVSALVWGDFACFTRPESKVERVSYPLITPSAARGVLEAIFWHPEMRYEIRRIGVHQLGRQMVILRNELAHRQVELPIIVEEIRQQRSSLVLKDVAYIIEARVVVRPHCMSPVAKYVSQIERRIARGQCHHTPYLGTREFAADFGPVTESQPANIDLQIGTMLFDFAFVESTNDAKMTFRRPGRQQPVTGYAHALFLNDARVTGGWLTVPAERYQALYRLEANGV